MKILQFNENEKRSISEYGCFCIAVAEECLRRNNLNFDDIEEINQYSENHEWGSNADRKYRKAAINKAILKVAKNPLIYGTL